MKNPTLLAFCSFCVLVFYSAAAVSEVNEPSQAQYQALLECQAAAAETPYGAHPSSCLVEFTTDGKGYYDSRGCNSTACKGFAYSARHRFELEECEPPKQWVQDHEAMSYCRLAPIECGTDTILDGASINGGFGSGVYDVQGCAYSCGTNYSKLDGSTSMADAQECTGLGQEYTTDDPSDYPETPAQCAVKAADGSCLDMAQQPGGSCPAGTTYGQVNGTDVCVPAGTPNDGLDPGTGGQPGEGGDKPADTGAGQGNSDGENDGKTTGPGKGYGNGQSQTTCTSTTDSSGNVTQECTTTSQSETDYGSVTTPEVGENQFYKPLDKTAQQVMTKFRTDVLATPIAQSVSGFFDVDIAGSCPVWTIPGVWVFDPIPIDAQCSPIMNSIWPYIAAIMIATCAFLAFRIAVL